MNARTIRLLITALAFGGGCKLMTYSTMVGDHFRFGTVYEKDSPKSVPDVVRNCKIVLSERDFSLRKVEESEEAAQIHAAKNGVEYILDLKSIGTGTLIHIEASQAGNDMEVWSILNDVLALP